MLASKQFNKCQKCKSESIRSSRRQSALDSILGLLGVRALRCQSCGKRFYAFTPLLNQCEQKVKSVRVPKPVPLLPTLPVPYYVPTVARVSPVEEIQAIEEEWNRRIRPEGMVEETLCAQLAHVTWHLRCLHSAERETIAAAGKNHGFNYESAISLMRWRLSAESALTTALDQLESYRNMANREFDDMGEFRNSRDLLSLAQGAGQCDG